MNKQELIKEFEEIGIYNLNMFGAEVKSIPTETAIKLIKQLDEPKTGHADEAPRYLKNILARLRELPLHNREVWLKVIMSEFKQDFSNAKWREGYEQGKLEGMVERKKVKVKQFVADWYEANKDDFEGNLYRCTHNIPSIFDGAKLNEFEKWFLNASTKPFQTLVNMHQFGYEVEKESKYIVKLKNVPYLFGILNFSKHSKQWYFSDSNTNRTHVTKHTRKEVEEAGFGWVFGCPGIEIEEE